ncbi:hypothetical protein VNI00_018565 [Paramarasmius palmivorus]|uniref:F-box domain-containing protein n=1 Tax=Paramarasmius palmivorus TaxID=297713 RepID=A0AAW0AXE4_9AGAR
MDAECTHRMLSVIGPLPRLHTLHLGAQPYLDSLHDDILQNLISFSIDGDKRPVHRGRSLFLLISRMHRLEHLSLSWADYTIRQTPDSVTLQHLHIIDIYAWPVEFNFFTFPSLRHVRIGVINVTTINIQGFAKVLPQLRTLTFNRFPPMDVTLHSIMSLLTNIEELALLHAPVGWRFLNSLANPTIMPHLRKLRVCGSFFVSETAFKDATLSRGPGFEGTFEAVPRPVSVAGVDVVPATHDDVMWNESLTALHSVARPGPVQCPDSTFQYPDDFYRSDAGHTIVSYSHVKFGGRLTGA